MRLDSLFAKADLPSQSRRFRAGTGAVSSACNHRKIASDSFKSEKLLLTRFDLEDGISLLEAMVSTGVIAIIAAGLIYSQLLSNKIAHKSRYTEVSKVALRELVDRFQSVDGTDLLVEVTAGYVGTNLGFTDVDNSVSGTQIYLYDSPSQTTPATVDPKIEKRAYLEVTIDRQVTALASTGNAVLLGSTFRIYYGKKGEVIPTYNENWSQIEKDKYVLQTMSTNRCIP